MATAPLTGQDYALAAFKSGNYSSQPLKALSYLQPDMEIQEKEKFHTDSSGCPTWFLALSRWVTAAFYNPPFIPGDFHVSINGMPKTINEEIAENLTTYYGFQSDNILGYAKSDASVHIPGQTVRVLEGHITGNAIKLVQPIQDQITAIGNSDEIMKAKKEFADHVELQYKLRDKLAVNAQLGVQMMPVAKEMPETIQDVEEAKREFRHDYEIASEILTKSMYQLNDMDDMFINAVKHITISNGASIHFSTKKGRNGQVVPFAEIIPMQQRILDTRCTNQFLDEQMVGGYVQYKTPSEVFAAYPDLTYQARQEIQEVSQGIGDWITNYKQYYNYPNAVTWTADGKCAVVRIYAVVRRDLRYTLKTNKFGQEFYQKIDDSKTYNPTHYGITPTYNDNGKMVHIKGEDIAGSKWTWDVVYCDVIGNKFVGDWGYVSYLVRDQFDKSMPKIPMVNIWHDSVNGLGRSYVGRIKFHQFQMDRIQTKIQEIREQDLGKSLVVYADKLDKSVLDIIKDIRGFHVTILPNESGNVNDGGKGRGAEVIDMTRNGEFLSYIEHYKFLRDEMMAIVNATDMTLGAQQTTHGKGELQSAISQSTLSMMYFYTSLQKYFDRVLNYGLNLYKNCAKPGDITLPVSAKQVETISVTKGFKNADVGIYIYGSDNINEQNKQMLLTFMQALFQNSQTLAEIGLDPMSLLKIANMIMRNSYNQDISEIEKKVESNKKNIDAQNMMKAKQEQDAVSQTASMQQQTQIQIQAMQNKMTIFEQENENYRAEISALSKSLSDLLKHMQTDPTLAQNNPLGMNQPPPNPPAQ